MIISHCRNKDTQPLKELCNCIIRSPQVIDVMTLFAKPTSFLGPLCSLLDSWNWDEIHGKSRALRLGAKLKSTQAKVNPSMKNLGQYYYWCSVRWTDSN